MESILVLVRSAPSCDGPTRFLEILPEGGTYNLQLPESKSAYRFCTYFYTFLLKKESVSLSKFELSIFRKCLIVKGDA